MPSPPPIQLIRGGPGAGKTAQLVQTIQEAILTDGLSPVRVLALCLDQPAREGLRERLVPASCRAGHNLIPVIHTYEDLAEQILRQSRSYQSGAIIRPLAERLLVGETIRRTSSQARYYRSPRVRQSGRFRDDVADFIAELKRCKIDPLVFREQIILGLPSAQALADLADIYEQYQQRLQEAGVCDVRGIIWLALEALKDRQLAACWQQRWDLIVADDLQDATLSQVELLTTVCGPGTRLVATCEPAQTIYRFRGAVGDAAPLLRTLFPRRRVVQQSLDDRQPGRLSVQVGTVARRFAQQQELGSAPVSCSDECGAVEVRVYRSFAEELAGIGADIVQALQQADATPGQFAIIARHRTPAQAAAEHLALRGIPVAGYEASVGQWSAIRLLGDVLDLLLFLRDGERYPAAERQRRVAQANRAITRLATLTSAGPGEATELARLYHHCSRQRRLMLPQTRPQAGVSALQQWQRALTEAVKLPAAAALSHVIIATSLIRCLAQRDGEGTVAALARLLNALGETDRAFMQVTASALELEAARTLVEGVPDLDLASGEGVAVLTAHATRGRQFRTVYVLGLNEDRFPAPPRVSRLLPRTTISALHERAARHQGIAAPTLTFAGFGEAPEEAYAEEARLFYTCLTRANERLVLTCHYEEEGTSIAPSPFLVSTLPVDFALAPVEAQQQADFACVFAGLAPETAAGRSDHEECPVAVCAGRPLTQIRKPPAPQRRPVRPDVRRKPVLATAGEWAASASSINHYLRCPRLFFLGHLLGLGTEEHDAMLYGSIIHGFLAQLHALPPSERGAEAAHRLLDQALRDDESDFSSDYSFRVYQQRAHDSLKAYLESDYFRELSEAREHRFTVQLADETGLPHLFTGRIDQVAGLADGVAVVDYKTGSVDSAAAVRRAFCYRPERDQAKEPPADYQLPLYVLGWESESGAAGQVSQVALQGFQPAGGNGARRVTVELIAGREPGEKEFSRAELARIALYLAETARQIKTRRGFEGHPPAEGCSPRFKTCPFVLICGEAEPS